MGAAAADSQQRVEALTRSAEVERAFREEEKGAWSQEAARLRAQVPPRPLEPRTPRRQHAPYTPLTLFALSLKHTYTHKRPPPPHSPSLARTTNHMM